MKSTYYSKKGITLAIVILIVGALCLLTSSAFAANDSMNQSQPASAGAGAAYMPVAQATNTGTTAWIYTSNIVATMPTQTTGSIQLSALDASPTDVATSSDRANVAATFALGNSNYTVKFTCVTPVGSTYSHFGGVGVLRPVFGTTGIGGLNLPQTLAYVAIFGNATITKDGQALADGQPAMVFLTQAMHDPTTQAWLTTPDATRQEIQLIVPGPIQGGGTAMQGMPNGFFYAYWPDPAVQITNISAGGTVNLTDIAPVATPLCPPSMSTTRTTTATPATRPGAGPAAVGRITINLTNSGIQTQTTTTGAGLYDVSIVNRASKPRGLLIRGIDLCCTEYNRFSKMIKPGATESFRWYFASGKITMREFISARKTGRSFTDVQYSGKEANINFK